MPNLNKYHVYVTFPGIGETEVFPTNDTMRYGWEYTNEVWRKKLDTKLWFINEPGSTKTFDIFASMELEECGCHRLNMRVTLECSGGTENDLFHGILFFIDGTWYFDFCSVEIKPRVDDPFECLFKNWETDKNILEGSGDSITLSTDLGEFEEVVCFAEYDPAVLADYVGVYETSCLGAEPGGDWTVKIHDADQIATTVQVFTTWIREVFNGAGPPAGAGWTQVTPIFWTRPAILQGPVVFDEQPVSYYAEWRIVSRTLDNGRLLSSVMNNLFSSCSDYPLRSDFLGIDPDGQAPANDAYTFAQLWLWNAVVFQMSDVVRLDAGENASIAMINLADLLNCLRRWLKAFLYFDEENQVYRIEHNSFERHNKLMNLVTMRPDAIRGYNTYEYVKVRIPQKEVFKWPFQTNDIDWDGASIVYADCNDVGRVETYEIECFHTDFGSLVGSGIVDIDVLKGLVIVSQYEGQINRAVGDISGILKVNGGLSWANIVRELWRWRMPSCQATVNGAVTSFLSLIPKIKQIGFQAELCCLDILTLNPALDRVRTGLGNGYFYENVELDLGSGLLDFNLVFAPPITLIDLSISISVNDDNQCYYTDFIFETNEDFPSGVVITWDFGVGAVPPTAEGQGPHNVYYTSAGVKTVTVTASYNGEEEMAQTTVTVITCLANITGLVYDIDLFPFQGVNVRLFNDVNEDGISDGGTPVRSIFTNSGGNIAMASLTPGYYVMVCITPSGWELDEDVHLDIGSHPGNNLPNVSPTDLVIPIRLVPSELDAGSRFSFSPLPGTISGTVFDNLGNPIAGAVINIHDDSNLDGVADGGIVYSGVTNGSGAYSINGVTVTGGGHSGPLATTIYHQYVIILTVPPGYTIVSGIDTSNDGDLVTNTPTTDNVIPCTMRAGEVDANNNFIIQ